MTNKDGASSVAQETAVVVGVGPGLGWHLVKRFAAAGMKVIMAARRQDRLEALLAAEPLEGVTPVACDVSDPAAVERLFAQAGTPDVVVFNVGGSFATSSILDLTAETMERSWRRGCLGGFLVGQAAIRAMHARGSGTVIFTGATASKRGSKGFAAFAMPSFAMRAVAQSMAREFGPQGIHIGYVIIDGEIAQAEGAERARDTKLDPAAIAEAYYQLHRQDRSAWTLEMDLRPAAERF